MNERETGGSDGPPTRPPSREADRRPLGESTPVAGDATAGLRDAFSSRNWWRWWRTQVCSGGHLSFIGEGSESQSESICIRTRPPSALWEISSGRCRYCWIFAQKQLSSAPLTAGQLFSHTQMAPVSIYWPSHFALFRTFLDIFSLLPLGPKQVKMPFRQRRRIPSTDQLKLKLKFYGKGSRDLLTLFTHRRVLKMSESFVI